jgi:hypothetical protein
MPSAIQRRGDLLTLASRVNTGHHFSHSSPARIMPG